MGKLNYVIAQIGAPVFGEQAPTQAPVLGKQTPTEKQLP